MSTLSNRPHTAVLVIDVQDDVVARAHRRDDVIDAINRVVDHARARDVPVIWIQHDDEDLPADSSGWRLVERLHTDADDPVIRKHHGDSFEDTTLESELARLGVGRLVVTGAQTDACVRSTLHGAFVRGYDTVLVADAHTTEDFSEYGAPPPEQVIAHTNLYWRVQTAPGRTAAVVDAGDVDFG